MTELSDVMMTSSFPDLYKIGGWEVGLVNTSVVDTILYVELFISVWLVFLSLSN